MIVLGHGAFRILDIRTFSLFELYWGLHKTSFRFSKQVNILIKINSSPLDSDIKVGNEMAGFVTNA
jgi:hypothetical protein